jgi:hypothetical protein
VIDPSASLFFVQKLYTPYSLVPLRTLDEKWSWHVHCFLQEVQSDRISAARSFGILNYKNFQSMMGFHFVFHFTGLDSFPCLGSSSVLAIAGTLTSLMLSESTRKILELRWLKDILPYESCTRHQTSKNTTMCTEYNSEC